MNENNDLFKLAQSKLFTLETALASAVDPSAKVKIEQDILDIKKEMTKLSSNPMDNHFLTNIDIIDFKCFQNFSAKGFKRVNLIGGKNNIGKTAFMEACYVNVYSTNIDTMITAIYDIKFMRENINFIEKKIENIEILNATKNYMVNSNIGYREFFILEKDATKEYQFTINKESKDINISQLNIFLKRVNNIIFIDNFGLTNGELMDIYQIIQKLDKEHELNKLIQGFDKNIGNFKVIGDKPQCKVNDEYREITEFGDGLKHYISIGCALYACKNGYLFIDEVDNGIHYQQLDRLWEIILKISKETNCQVFATTHSKEMIESFARVSQKLNEQDISFMTLVKNDKNEIKALVRNYELFLDSIEQEHEIRW